MILWAILLAINILINLVVCGYLSRDGLNEFHYMMAIGLAPLWLAVVIVLFLGSCAHDLGEWLAS